MKTKYFSMYGKAIDAEGAEHIVTVVGKYEQSKIKTEKVEEAILSFDEDTKAQNATVIIPFKQSLRTLKLAYSICHPNDEFNEEIGVNIAKRRIKCGDYIGELSSTNVTMLNDDQCNLLLFGELNYIIKNIDKYLPQNED